MGAMGQTVARWRLGDELRQRREAAGLSQEEVADYLGCKISKIKKIERGAVGVYRPDMILYLQLTGDTSKEARSRLEEIRAAGNQRGWWSRYSRHLSAEQATFYGIEASARTVRAWQPFVVHGLLQTERYARALAGTWDIDSEDADRYVSIRMERQKTNWDNGLTMRAVIDESVLRRTLGDTDAMVEQLDRLLTLPEDCTLQVMPLATSHAATTGALSIFEFDYDERGPVVHSETPVGSLYAEDDAVEASRNLMDNLMASALPPPDSAKLIRAIMKEFT